MIYSSLAILAVAASATIPPFGNLFHMHPHAKPDDRVSVIVVNHGKSFQDVSVDGHVYTITADSNICIKAPVGTIVYRATSRPYHPKGEVLLAMTPEANDQKVELK